jgi:hypothetical protein
MVLDLEALFGQEQGPINVPPNAPQDYTMPNPGNIHWNAPTTLPTMNEEMGQLDVLLPYFTDRPNLNAEWDDLMKSFA